MVCKHEQRISVYVQMILKELFRVSKKYVLTLVPRKELYSTISAAILRPPKEYKRADIEWIRLHQRLGPKCIESERIRFGVLSILCEVKGCDDGQ